jgi:hypothetical protein
MSMLRALRKYIQMVVAEVAKNPAAPQQLIEPDRGSKEEEKEEVEEMNVTANISGPMLPLGMSPDGGKKRRKKADWK